MPTYACHNGKEFLVTVDAASKTEAETKTSLTAVKTTNRKPWAGWIIDNNVYKSPPPFPSWSWNGTEWVSPEPKPEGSDTPYYWNESEQKWLIVEQEKPYPSWVVDEYNGCWIAPKIKPENYEIIVNEDGSTSIIETQGIYVWNESIQDWELVN